jgi:hypothetical protein
MAFRWTLFLYVSCILCPIQYIFPSTNLDNSWMFALNDAAAHRLVLGRDVVWTWGPLAYLVFPFDIGNNLAKGLAFQAGLWLLIIAIIAGIFLRAGLPLRNLIVFSVLLSFFVPAYQFGMALLCAGLLLLVHFRLRGGIRLYVGALILLGLTPLIEFYGAVVAAGVVAGLIADYLWRGGRRHGLELGLTVTIPTTVAVLSCRLALGSFRAVAGYFRTSFELARGYGVAMSLWGPRVELIAAIEALVLFAAALTLLAKCDYQRARFFGLIFAIPLLLTLKHGFVRQDAPHVANFFCFAALTLALVVLAVPLQARTMQVGMALVLLLFATLWQDYVFRDSPRLTTAAITGSRTPARLWNALHFSRLRRSLAREEQVDFSADARVGPEIRSIVGDEPTAFLSHSYSNAVLDGINLVLPPVLQAYSAYTPYLDQLNAAWVEKKGPRFLIFDGAAIDGRQPWAQTPRTWTTVYRWYRTRWLGPHNLLLERRDGPRFTHLEPVAKVIAHLGQSLPMPAGSGFFFWTMPCPLASRGRLRALLFRIPPVMMEVSGTDGQIRKFRVILPMLGGPSPGNFLPRNLAEFAEVFSERQRFDFSIASLKFESADKSAYRPDCRLEFLEAVR